MPNWCNNYLTITAEPSVIKAILAKARGKTSPYSDEQREFSYYPFLQEKINACENFEAEWYEFMLANVGCKWFPEVAPGALYAGSGRISVTFCSPWSPPIEGTRMIAEWMRAEGFTFQLQLTYEEPGCAFCGVFTADENSEEDRNGDFVELDAAEIRQGKAEDYAEVCQTFGISFADLQAKATGDIECVTLCPNFYREHSHIDHVTATSSHNAWIDHLIQSVHEITTDTLQQMRTIIRGELDSRGDSDCIYMGWCVEDIQQQRPDLTVDQCREVLRTLSRRHDAQVGINWTVIDIIADDLYPSPEDDEEEE